MTADFSNAKLRQLSAHQVGNKTDGTLVVSKSALDINDENLRTYLLKLSLIHI